MRELPDIPDVERVLQTAELLDLLPNEDMCPFGNSISFDPKRGLLYFTVASMGPSGDTKAVIVRSDSELVPYKVEAICKEGFFPLSSTIDPDTGQMLSPSPLARWSGQGIRAFLDDPVWKGTPADLYQDLTRYLARFVDHDDHRVISFLAIYTMMSYVHVIFEALPLVLITGRRETGKTRTIEILSEVAFNGRIRGSITPAIFARQIQFDQPTLCVDEAEDLRSLFPLLRIMYRRSGVREVYDSKRRGALFQLFSPAILVNIAGMPDTLQDRTIELPSAQRRRPVERFHRHQQQRAFQFLRDTLYRFACAYGKAVYDSTLAIHESTLCRPGKGGQAPSGN